MKLLKRILLVAGILVGLGVILLLVALIPSVQRAMVLKFAQQPGTKLEAEGISAGFSGADVKKVRYEMPGVVVSLDSAHVETSLLGLAFGDRLAVDDVAVRGLVVDLSGREAPPPPEATRTVPVAPQGFLALAALPRALLVGRLALDGKLILPDAGGPRTATFTMTSGGIAPDAESTINCVINLPPAPDAASGETKIVLKLRQSADGRITGVSITANVQATVPAQPPVALTAIAELRSDGTRETWSVRVIPAPGNDAVVDANGTFEPATQEFNGSVRLAVAASILAPWLPADLPAGSVDGEARIALNLTTLDWNVNGVFDGAATGLAKLDARLTTFEPVKVHTELVARSTGGAIQAEKYTTTVFANDNQPLFEARLLRPIAINADGLPDQASLEGGPLAQVSLSGIPLSLAQPFLPEGMTLTGGAVTGAFNVTAQGDAFVVESTQPLTIANLHAALPGMPFVAGSDLTARLRARLDLAANRAIAESLELDLAPTTGHAPPTPSLALTLAQPLIIDLEAGDLALPTAGGTLAKLVMRGVPLEFIRSYLPENLTLSGGDIAGEITIESAGRAYVFDTTKPLAIPGLGVMMDGTTYVTGQDLSLGTRLRWDATADQLAIETLQLGLNSTGATAPALQLELAQPLPVDLATNEPTFAKNGTELVRATFAQFLVPDLSTLMPGLVVAPSTRLTGGLAVKSTATGWAFVSTQPLVLTPTSVTFAGQPMLDSAGITVTFDARLDDDVLSIPKGSLELLSGGGRALLADFSGETNLQTLLVPKFSLQASGDLAQLLAQPPARGLSSINAGTFAITVDGAITPEITAKGRITMDNLAAPALGTQRGQVASDFDVKAAADFLTLEASNTSQVTVGTRASSVTTFLQTIKKNGLIGFDAKISSPSLNLDDILAFAVAGSVPDTALETPAPKPVVAQTPPPVPTSPGTPRPAGPSTTAPPPAPVAPPPDIVPFWSDYHGTFTADIKRAVYQGNPLTDVVADLSIAPEAITVQRANLKLAGAPITAQGSMRFTEIRAASPYFIAGEAKGTNVDTAALFKMFQPDDPPMVATIANFDATISGTAPNLEGLAENVNTKLHLVGTKGETRLFAAKSELVTSIGKLTNSPLEGLIGLFDRKKKQEEPTADGRETKKKPSTGDYVRMAGQLVQFFGSTPFDRCEIEASSEGMRQFTVSQLTFDSPLVDIAANGSARIPESGGWSSLIYQLELTRFGASGEIGELLTQVAETAPAKEGESFTYLAQPVPVSGNLAESDTIQLMAALLSKARPYLSLIREFLP